MLWKHSLRLLLCAQTTVAIRMGLISQKFLKITWFSTWMQRETQKTGIEKWGRDSWVRFTSNLSALQVQNLSVCKVAEESDAEFSSCHWNCVPASSLGKLQEPQRRVKGGITFSGGPEKGTRITHTHWNLDTLLAQTSLKLCLYLRVWICIFTQKLGDFRGIS